MDFIKYDGITTDVKDHSCEQQVSVFTVKLIKIERDDEKEEYKIDIEECLAEISCWGVCLQGQGSRRTQEQQRALDSLDDATHLWLSF